MLATVCIAVHITLFYIQISRAILGQDQKLRLPKFLEEEEKSPEATKQVCSCSLACMSTHLFCMLPNLSTGYTMSKSNN